MSEEAKMVKNGNRRKQKKKVRREKDRINKKLETIVFIKEEARCIGIERTKKLEGRW